MCGGGDCVEQGVGTLAQKCFSVDLYRRIEFLQSAFFFLHNFFIVIVEERE